MTLTLHTLMRFFNEAPAEDGGKPRAGACSPAGAALFNEAPAEDGGKPGGVLRCPASTPTALFNEAPAEDGGKHLEQPDSLITAKLLQ